MCDAENQLTISISVTPRSQTTCLRCRTQQCACAGPLSVCDAPPGAHALVIIFPDQFAQPSEYEQLAFAIQVNLVCLCMEDDCSDDLPGEGLRACVERAIGVKSAGGCTAGVAVDTLPVMWVCCLPDLAEPGVQLGQTALLNSTSQCQHEEQV